MRFEYAIDRLRTPAALPLGVGLLLTVAAVVRFVTGAYSGATIAGIAAMLCYGFAVVVE